MVTSEQSAASVVVVVASVAAAGVAASSSSSSSSSPSSTSSSAAAVAAATSSNQRSDNESRLPTISSLQSAEAAAQSALRNNRAIENTIGDPFRIDSIASDHEEQTTNDFMNDLLNGTSDWISLVRRMIANNLLAIVGISLVICVIIIYLVYYFSQISKKPKLVGNKRSEFVRFVSNNLSKTLNTRFNPLIYFWGTNAQTALFGYLQGQTSTDEMPRNQFKRQYLYVSDAQYLTSNVDLSRHYATSKRARGSHKCNNANDANNAGCNCNGEPNTKLQLLQVNENLLQRQLDQFNEHSATSQLDRNVRLVLDELLQSRKQHNQPNHQSNLRLKLNQHQQPAAISTVRDNKQQNDTDTDINTSPNSTPVSLNSLPGLKRLKELDLSSSSASSSDSGVFPSGCHSSSSSSSSTSSLTDDFSCSVDLSSALKCGCQSGQQATSAEFGLVDQSDQDHNNSTIAPEQMEFGQCALDWHKPSHKNYHENKLVALISAGMTTGSDKKYVTDTVKTLSSLGYEVCVFIRRGVGGLKLSSSKFFSPAKWRDFEAALMSVRQQRPEACLVAVGFSFGSIELCRYLSMSGKQSLVHAALLVSCPFDPEAGGRNMRRRALNRKIDAYLAQSLGKQLYQASLSSSASASETAETKRSTERSLCVSNFNGSTCDLSHLPKIKSLVDFEDNYNRIIQHYPSSEAYAADCRLHDHLQHIETPTLCLSSEDDFMAPLSLLPLQQIESNENLCMVLTKRGGHMAFVDGLVWPKKPYFAQRIIGSYMTGVKGLLPRPDRGHSNRMLSAESRQDSASSAKSHWHLIPMFDNGK